MGTSTGRRTKLLAASDGYLYGSTEGNTPQGVGAHGTIFKVLPSGASYTTIFIFSSNNYGNASELIQGPDGNFYTSFGGNSQGWAEVGSSGRIAVLTIFKQSVPGRPDSEGTVTGLQSGNRILLPFDNSKGYVTGVALANTNPAQTLTISLQFQLENGLQGTGTMTLGPRAHTAFGCGHADRNQRIACSSISFETVWGPSNS